MARRTKRVRLDKVILGAAKEIRKKKLDFERQASKALSEALGFLVVVKIQKQVPATISTSMRRARAMKPAAVAELINRQIEINAEELPDFLM